MENYALGKLLFSACAGEGIGRRWSLTNMIAPETFSHIENIKKRAGYLWRYL
jgi:hypothetical protein